MEVYEAHQDLEPARALLGHARVDTTQIFASIPPEQFRAPCLWRRVPSESARNISIAA